MPPKNDDQKPPDPQEEPPRVRDIHEVKGNLIFMLNRKPPGIPDERQLRCPQCTAVVGDKSEWCWSCGYSFGEPERKRRLRLLRLLLMSLAVNIILGTVILVDRW